MTVEELLSELKSEYKIAQAWAKSYSIKEMRALVDGDSDADYYAKLYNECRDEAKRLFEIIKEIEKRVP